MASVATRRDEGGDGADGLPVRPWLAFAVLGLTSALTIMDVSKVGVALPVIRDAVHGSDGSIQLMVVGYTVAYAVFLLPSGRLGDIVPRKAVFLVGSAVFACASVWCALAQSAGLLVAGRLVQGAGAGILMPQVLGIIQHLFPRDRRAKPLALLAAVTATTATVGPVIAGLVIDAAGPELGWRLLFWIDVAGEGVALPLAWWLLREPRAPRRPGFDVVGVVLLVPAIALTVMPVSMISKDTPFAPWMAVCVAAGLACGAALLAHERRLARSALEPLVDLSLLRARHFPAGVLISGLSYANGTAGTLTVTLFYEEYAGESPLRTAAWMLPSAVAMIFGSWFAARAPMRANRGMVVLGSAANGVGLIVVAGAIAGLPMSALPAVIAAVLLAKSFGGSFAQSPNQVRSLQFVPPYRSSIAASMLQASQRIGSALGMAVALIIYYGYGRDTLGPTIAVAVCGAFSVLAAVVAVLDRDAGQAAGPEPAPAGRAAALPVQQ
ncbi:MFS transporter [Dactylosporangium sp. CA-092794]|uniref:MFS transporter n=1 Tax=Dactylosporangium sp. CA-092794 TaxID=3239929 RepID=UPI003D932F69